MTEPDDMIAQAFANVRREAKKRNGTVPDLKRKTRAPRPRRRGIPTGKDGRRLPPRDRTESFGSIVSREVTRRGWEKSIAAGWVGSNWSEIVGDLVASHTKIEMYKDQKLFITCDSTAWATNLRMMQRQILQTIAEKVGPNIVLELRIFGPKAPSWRHGPLHVKGRGPRDTYG